MGQGIMHYFRLIGEAMSGINILINILDILILSFIIFNTTCRKTTY